MRPLILFSPARVAATISHHHPRHRRENGGPVITGIYWIPAFAGMTTFYLGASCSTHSTGVKNGSGAPSVVLNTTLTFWPIFSFAISQSTKLVSSDGPSFSVT